MTPKQKLAKERNWTKLRLLGAWNNINKSVLTEREKNIVNSINLSLQILINEWDENSIELGLKPKPTYKITLLGKEWLTKSKKVVEMYRNYKDAKIEKL